MALCPRDPSTSRRASGEGREPPFTWPSSANSHADMAYSVGRGGWPWSRLLGSRAEESMYRGRYGVSSGFVLPRQEGETSYEDPSATSWAVGVPPRGPRRHLAHAGGGTSRSDYRLGISGCLLGLVHAYGTL